MKNLISVILFQLVPLYICFGQYNTSGLVLSGGINYSQYFGEGEGNNYFQVDNPGAQLELTVNDGNGFEWIIYGTSYSEALNITGNSQVYVSFWTPYYTEFSWYQAEKKHPFFMFFGYDCVAMRFKSAEKPDYHHNITVGAGWNLKLVDRIFLQFKIKPYLILDNSVGQRIGVNAMANLHFRTRK